MSNKDHKLAAIVFTDIVGYTKRMEENEQLTMQLLQKQREIIFPIVESYGGEIIKEIGDGLLMMFGSAVEAVRCTISIQTRLKDEELTIRAGIHIGDVIFKGGDVFGSAVNTAARIEPLAPPNGICISETVRKQLENKDDITTVSIGKKELKGVGVPVEIFQVIIEGVTAKQKLSAVNILKDLWTRYVIQILIGYLIAAWIIKQAVAAITTKYLLSPHLVDLTWVILLSLIPTVFLLAYFHGRRSSGKWTKVELIGFPINAVLAILLLVIMFKGKDLGAATTTKTFENENGEKVERAVPKSEFRKKALLFFFDNESNDTAQNWLQYAIPGMIVYDLSQDIFIETTSIMLHVDKLKDAGFKDGIGAPLMLKKKIASSYHLNYFISGSFSVTDNEFRITTMLYDTDRGNLISETTFSGEDIFPLIDEISVKLKKDMDVPEGQVSSAKDLPIAEIYTSSLSALKYFTKGFVQTNLYNDWPKGTTLMEKAIQEDPVFAIAQLQIAENYFSNNQTDKVKATLQNTMDNLYKLPERQQFQAKFFYYLIQQNPDKALAVVKMWVELFPEDIMAHEMLAERYILKNMFHKTISEYEVILELDPEQVKYIRRIGDLYEEMGELDSAMMYHQKYADQFPQDYLSYKNIGEIYLIQADFENAKANFEKALLLEPDAISSLLALADIELQTGQFEQALEQYLEIMNYCKSAADSSRVYDALDKYYTIRGQMRKSIEYLELRQQEIAKFASPLNSQVNKLFFVNKYIKAGNPKKAMRIIEEVKSKLKPPVDKVAAFGYMFYFIELKDADKAEPYIAEANELAIGFGEEMLQINILYAEAEISEIKGEYISAIEKFKAFLAARPNDHNINRHIARCYRLMGESRKAEEYIKIALKYYPYNPENNLEMGLICLQQDDQQKAQEYLEIANDIWIDADADYEPAIEAKNAFMEVRNI